MGGASGSLEGRVILVTRAKTEAAILIDLLERRGARPMVAPAIELLAAPEGPLDRAVEELAEGRFDWVVFTSAAGVEAVFRRLEAKGRGGDSLQARVAAVGEGTAGALRHRGVEPALVPSTFTTEALGRAMPEGTGRILLARADRASGDLDAALARKGWTLVRVDAYRTTLASELPVDVERALREGTVDAVTFTSASTVRGFMGVAGGALKASPRPSQVVCIGPVTAEAARAAGLTVGAVAEPHTIEGVVVALERMFAQPTRTRAAEREARA